MDNQSANKNLDFIGEAVGKSLGSEPLKKNKINPKNSAIHGNVRKKYLKKCAANNVEPNIEGFMEIATGYQSKAGGKLEHAFSVAANVATPQNFTHYRGSTIMAVIKKYKAVLKQREYADPDTIINELNATYFCDKSWLKSVLLPVDGTANNKKPSYLPISIPDDIAIEIKDDGKVEIKLAEAKLSGELDSKNGPANVLSLSHNKCYVADENISIKKAIILTGTRQDDNGNFPMLSRWAALANRLDASIEVKCNQDAFEWITGINLSREKYEQYVLAKVEDDLMERVFHDLH